MVRSGDPRTKEAVHLEIEIVASWVCRVTHVGKDSYPSDQIVRKTQSQVSANLRRDNCCSVDAAELDRL